MPTSIPSFAPEPVAPSSSAASSTPPEFREMRGQPRKNFRDLLDGGGKGADLRQQKLPAEKDAAKNCLGGAASPKATTSLASQSSDANQEAVASQESDDTEATDDMEASAEKKELPAFLAALLPYLPLEARKALQAAGFDLGEFSIDPTAANAQPDATAALGLSEESGRGLHLGRIIRQLAPSEKSGVEGAPQAPGQIKANLPQGFDQSLFNAQGLMKLPKDFAELMRSAQVPEETIAAVCESLGVVETKAGLIPNGKMRAEIVEVNSALQALVADTRQAATPVNRSMDLSGGKESDVTEETTPAAAAVQETPAEFVRTAKIAAPGDSHTAKIASRVLTPVGEQKQKTFNVDDQLDAELLSTVGMDTAIRGEPTMVPSSSHFEPALRAPDAPVAGREVQEPRPSFAARAVEVVRELREVSATLSPSNRRVDMNFDFGPGEKLAVRLEVRAGEVHATFRTSSTELRDALAQAWQGEANRDSKQKFADPVFASADRGFSQSFSQGDARQQRQAQQGEDHASRTFSSVLLSSSRPAPVAAAAPLSNPVVASDRQLQAFA